MTTVPFNSFLAAAPRLECTPLLGVIADHARSLPRVCALQRSSPPVLSGDAELPSVSDTGLFRDRFCPQVARRTCVPLIPS